VKNGFRRFLALSTGTALLGAPACVPTSPIQDADLESLRVIIQQVDEARLKSTVEALANAHLEDTPLDCSHLDVHRDFSPMCHLTRDKARELMQNRLGELGLEVQRNEQLSRELLTTNIYANLPGTTHPEEIVLVGAHFDAFWAGADDNGSGVAAVLELAHVLSQYPLERTVRFVGFDMEEMGDVGSSRYASTISGERIVSALIFDSIGYYSSEPGSQFPIPGLPSPDTGDFLAVISNEASSSRAAEVYALNDSLELMKLNPIIVPQDGATPATSDMLRSDHLPFWLVGHQALFVTDTAAFRNPNYHRKTDLPETLDYATYTKAVQLSAATIAYWAGGAR
jgi:hypothetical protein